MTFEHIIFPELRCIALRYRGEISSADVKQSSIRLWSDPLYDRTYNGIVDLTGSTTLGRADDIPELIEFYKRPETSTGRWAVIVSEPKATALSLLFKTATVPQPWIEIFTSWESACSFLRVRIPSTIFENATEPSAS